MTVHLRAPLACASVAFFVLSVLFAVSRADAAPDATLTFDPGQACTFGLQIDITGAPQVNKTLTGPDGRVRVLAAGKGSDLVFTNLATGKTLALKGNGSVTWTKFEASGAARLTLTGHNVLIYFPTDIPAGPSTTLVVGREDIALDPATFGFTRLSRTGNTTDLCAALS